MKFLTVDDSVTIRKLIQRALAEMGYKKVYEAKDGLDALRVLKSIPDIDVAFIDWNMPNMDGLELVKKIREEKQFEDLKIIMATTEGTKEKVLQALDAGADNYIVKPFSDRTLQEHLLPVLGSMQPTGSLDDIAAMLEQESCSGINVDGNKLVIGFPGHKLVLDLPTAIHHGALFMEKVSG